MSANRNPYDLFVIGGGVNGCGIARDAAGRNLKVGLAERHDLASATSSSSSKLFHGGLRYLEHFDIRLVRESLSERNRLLHAMPHISWPMRFVLPHNKDLRLNDDTPLTKLTRRLMPWLGGKRPAWMLRMGLFLYDNIGGSSSLPGTSAVELAAAPHTGVLRDSYSIGFEYSDCWIDDARLVVLNACDARQRGADIFTHTEVINAKRSGKLWRITLKDARGERTATAKALVNAAGSWVNAVQKSCSETKETPRLRLVRGSHIVVKQVYTHDRCYILPGGDGRVIFSMPYEGSFTLIGTTDVEQDAPEPVECSDEEVDYLLSCAGAYFANPPTRKDVVWTYAGVRSLFASADGSASAASRDYSFALDAGKGMPPLLNVFGGKITTYRRLAEHALEKLQAHLPGAAARWTSGVPLPGGDFAMGRFAEKCEQLIEQYSFLDEKWATRLVRLYGTSATKLLGSATTAKDLGLDFGASLTEAEARYLQENELAQSAADILWRRTKLGLHLSESQTRKFEAWFGTS